MAAKLLFPTLLLFFSAPQIHSSSPVNITIVGTVFCDACSENTFSKHSYFLQGAKVQIVCKFTTKTSSEEISINTERLTDKFGVYKLEIPPVDGFVCNEGKSMDSSCKASLIQSPSSLCNIPSLSSSNEYLAVKAGLLNSCVYDLSALSYKPAQTDASFCRIKRGDGASLVTVKQNNLNSALFFWPPFFPWPKCSPFLSPFPFPLPTIPFYAPSPPPKLQFPFPPFNPVPAIFLPPPAFPIFYPPLPPFYHFPSWSSPPPAYSLDESEKKIERP